MFEEDMMTESEKGMTYYERMDDRLKMFGSVSLEMLKQDCNDMQRVSKHVIEGIK
jgi:hypothetical protein